MKKTLKLKLIESNETPEVNDIVLACGGYLRLQKEKSTKVVEKVYKPILISDEEIKVGDTVLANYEFNNASIETLLSIGKHFCNIGYELMTNRCKKVEVTSEQIPTNILEAIVEGKLKDGDNVEVEYQDIIETRLKRNVNEMWKEDDVIGTSLNKNGLSKKKAEWLDKFDLDNSANAFGFVGGRNSLFKQTFNDIETIRVKLDSNNKAICSIPEEYIQCKGRTTRISQDMYSEDTMCLNMQYYMEYVQANGYITPHAWLNNHKHF